MSILMMIFQYFQLNCYPFNYYKCLLLVIRKEKKNSKKKKNSYYYN